MTSLNTALRLIDSVAGHARNQAVHNAAANRHEDAGRDDDAQNRRDARDREGALVRARSEQLATFIRDQAARIEALEAQLETRHNPSEPRA